MESLPIKRLTQELLEKVAEQSSKNHRQRQNYNFHHHSEKVERFVNVLQPGTYVRPHRHIRPPEINGFEFFLVIQGAMGLLFMDETGQIIHQELVSANGSTLGIEVPEGTYHTAVALAPNTVTLEVKEGPYDPSTDKEFMEIFPLEGTPESKRLVETWQSYFVPTREVSAMVN
jgi:cupin fold WbuC family metalloprotein